MIENKNNIKFIEICIDQYSLAKRKLIFGVGINDASYKVNPRVDGKMLTCPYYQAWTNMLRRCYSEKYKQNQPTYDGCTVAKEWHLFSNFKIWMKNQDWKGKHLDKDVLIIGNKLYSKDTCIFISREVNNLLGISEILKSNQGCYYYKRDNVFVSFCQIEGKKKYLGRFKSKNEALKIYREEKYKEIIRIANTQQRKIKISLYNHAKRLLNDKS